MVMEMRMAPIVLAAAGQTVTMTAPGPVRLDDLRDPQFSPEARALLDAMATMAPGCRLEVDALLEVAAAQEGLDDFGDAADPTFRERLEVLLGAIRDEAELSPPGVVVAHAQFVQLLANRLRVTDLVARHPEILEIPVDDPIVIAGLPRTGTTHLHQVLAADPHLRSLPYWESLEPVPPRAELDAPTDPDPRRARTQQGIDFVDTCMPHFRRMHEMTVDHVHEEIQLLAIDVSTMLFETTFHVPTWRDYYKAHDQTPHYRYLRTVMQVCSWLRGGGRWVLKSPQHFEQFAALNTVFPQATVVLTHRDPASVMVSMAAMISYTARLQVARPDPVTLASYWCDRVRDLLEACTRDRELLPVERSIDVRFDDFMADDASVIEAVYRRAGRALDDTGRDAIRAYADSHPRGRHGTVIYEPEIFGIDVDEERRRLRHYTERFGVTAGA
jgi:hypothetical protein